MTQNNFSLGTAGQKPVVPNFKTGSQPNMGSQFTFNKTLQSVANPFGKPTSGDATGTA